MSEHLKPKQILSGEQKHDLWVRMLFEPITPSQAAAEAGVVSIDDLEPAQDGAIVAKPGWRHSVKEVSGERSCKPRSTGWATWSSNGPSGWRCCGEDLR